MNCSQLEPNMLTINSQLVTVQCPPRWSSPCPPRLKRSWSACWIASRQSLNSSDQFWSVFTFCSIPLLINTNLHHSIVIFVGTSIFQKYVCVCVCAFGKVFHYAFKIKNMCTKYIPVPCWFEMKRHIYTFLLFFSKCNFFLRGVKHQIKSLILGVVKFR